ncbi:MAG: sugar phosphate isomerase/epimerase [Ruminococcaceae bacterium]|nr:sugar phosphate isomerase/epimerase [Oscillospiraceae bacterium]
MKRSINAWSIPSDVGFEDMFRDISKAGFEGIELNVDRDDRSAHSLTMGMTKSELLNIRALAEANGLAIHSISTSLYGDSLGSPDAARRDFGKRLLLTQLDFAETLGADAILAVPGGISLDNSIKAARENSLSSLLSIKSEIEGSPVIVGLENVWNYFFAGPIDMVQFIDELNSPHIQAYFDIGNVAIFSEPWHWIELLDKRIAKIHVKDFVRTGTNAGTFVNLLEGSIDWKRSMDALRAAGYDGYITAELGTIAAAPQFLYDITSKALDTIFAL